MVNGNKKNAFLETFITNFNMQTEPTVKIYEKYIALGSILQENILKIRKFVCSEIGLTTVQGSSNILSSFQQFYFIITMYATTKALSRSEWIISNLNEIGATGSASSLIIFLMTI